MNNQLATLIKRITGDDVVKPGDYIPTHIAQAVIQLNGATWPGMFGTALQVLTTKCSEAEHAIMSAQVTLEGLATTRDAAILAANNAYNEKAPAYESSIAAAMAMLEEVQKMQALLAPYTPKSDAMSDGDHKNK